MKYTTDNGKYRIEALSAATFPGAMEMADRCRDDHGSRSRDDQSSYGSHMQLLTVVDEAVSIGCEVDKNPQAAEELVELCADVALDGVSLVAVATDTGDVAAVVFNKIQVATKSSTEKPFFNIFAEERCTQPSSRSLVEYMAKMDAKFNFFEKFNIDCSLEITFLGTAREHRQQKLATLLCEKSVELARKIKDEPISPLPLKDLGPKFAMLTPRKLPNTYPKICQALWTSKYSQAVGKSLNFKVYLQVPFTEFVYDGKTYAERIGPDPPFAEVAAYILY